MKPTGRRTVETEILTVSKTMDDENIQMELIAKLAAQVLSRHYPEHWWAVGFAPGRTLVIKNMAIQEGRYGYTVDAAKAATISELEAAIIYGGGELLERCNVSRGAWNGEMMNLKDLN